METREKYGAEALFCTTGGGGNPEIWSIARFCNVFGTPNWYEPGCAQCYLPRVLSCAMMYGGADSSIADSNALELYDYENAQIKCLVLWGAGPAYSAPASGGRMVNELRAKGVKTICIDPRFTPDAAKADIWLPIRPGTDVALQMAWIRYILENRRYDEEFVTRWTNLPYLVEVESRFFARAKKGENGAPDTFYVWDEKTASMQPMEYPYDEKLSPCLLYTSNLATLAPVMDNPNFRFVEADICDRDALYQLFEEEHPDMVVNFAAESHVDRSIENPGIFLETNIIGTSVLMDACRKYGIKRYHQVSTDEVYGDLPLDRPDLFFTEETPIHTSSPYSSSKAAADLLVLAYHRTYGLPVSISRCSNNYGPYHFPEKLIPLMIANALADKPLPVYGEGLNVRDWLYVEDHCKAIDLIIHNGRVGEVYNVGGHNEKKNIDIVKIICKELGKPESLITHVTDRKGHDMRYAIDPTKIHNELGWLPETKFEDGIKKTIQWYLDNREWWETIISGEYQNYYEKMYGNR